MEVTECDKHSSLLQRKINYFRKKFYSTGSSILVSSETIKKRSNLSAATDPNLIKLVRCNLQLRVVI